MSIPEFSLRLAAFWWPCAAALLMWAAFTGWGFGVATTIRPRREYGIGTLGAWGLALTGVVGGVLNLFGWISVVTARVYLGVGVAIALAAAGRALADRSRHQRRAVGPLVLVAGLVVAGLVLLAIVGGAAHRFNPHDDFHAYLDFPIKMLEAGRIGDDPFSERRMLEYGGQSFLHALTLGLVDLSQIHVLEFGVAPLILCAQLVGHARGRAIVGLVMGAFVLTSPIPLENLTSVMTGLVLFYALLECLADDPEMPESRSSASGRVRILTLVVAGLVTLKNSQLPGLGLILAAAYFVADRRPLLVRAREAVWIGGGVVVLLLPWMISMRESSGTLLYPLLGRGYSGSVYSRFIAVTCGSWTRAEFVREFEVLLRTPEVLAGALLAMLIAGFARTRGMRVAAWCSLGAYAAALVVDVANGGMGPRYVWAFTFSCLLFMLMEAMCGEERPASGVASRTNVVRAGAALVVVVLSVVHARTDAGTLVFLAKNGYETLAEARSNRSDVDQGAQRLRGLQTFVPAGQPILARLSRPFHLNFARNDVNIVDWPGGASPPPGMPIEGSAEDLAVYLRSHGRRYVMYSYGDEAGYSYAGFRHRIRPGDGYVARARVTTELTFAFQDRLEELGQRYARLADDGEVFVLDLNSPKP